MKKFNYTDPDTQELLSAEMTTQALHNARAARRLLDGSYAETFTYVLGVTQWGFDRQKTYVVCRSNMTGKMWAYKMVEAWGEDECIWSGIEGPAKLA